MLYFFLFSIPPTAFAETKLNIFIVHVFAIKNNNIVRPEPLHIVLGYVTALPEFSDEYCMNVFFCVPDTQVVVLRNIWYGDTVRIIAIW